MEAIVMAAGEGRRLRPLTERYAKPVLPIDGRPVLATLLQELASAGVAPVTVVAGHLGHQVEALCDGLGVRIAQQPRADGSADAVRRALAAGAQAPALVVAADTVFAPGDVGRFARAFEAGGCAGGMTARRHPVPSPARAATLFVDGLVRRVIDDDPGNPLATAPLWALGPGMLACLEGLPGPPFELAVAFRRAVDAGLPVLGLEIGPTRDLTHPLDLVEQNFSYLKALT